MKPDPFHESPRKRVEICVEDQTGNRKDPDFITSKLILVQIEGSLRSIIVFLSERRSTLSLRIKKGIKNRTQLKKLNK